MLYIKYTNVDINTRLPVTLEPARNGPDAPSVAGLVFGFALESEYPTTSPIFFGTAPDDSDISIPGVLAEITKEEFDAAQSAEMATREAQSKKRLTDRIADRRWRAEVGGTTVSGMSIVTDDRSKALITGAALRATRDETYTLRWKTPEGFVDLSAQQVLAIADAVSDHVQACFTREAVLLDAVAYGSITGAMIDEGWPA